MYNYKCGEALKETLGLWGRYYTAHVSWNPLPPSLVITFFLVNKADSSVFTVSGYEQ